MHRSNGPLCRHRGSLHFLILTVAFILLSASDIFAALPVIPHDPNPASGASNVQLNAHIVWFASGNDNDGVTYDLYLGKDPSPPLLVSNYDGRLYYPQGLESATTYYWKVVARDGQGGESEGPVWTFTTRTGSPPVITHYWSPANGATNLAVTFTTLQWEREDPDGQSVHCDVYLGTDPNPPLVVSNFGGMSWKPNDAFAFNTTYYWKIVARDTDGMETTGPIWSFTTGGNAYTPYSHDPSPADNGYGSLNTKLWWISVDWDGQVPTDDLYFGTAEPLPLVASGITSNVMREYSPGELQAGTKYYWRVVTSDGDHTATGQTWSFTAIPTLMGDVDFNGVVTPSDAACVLETYLRLGPDADYSPCAAINGAISRADVNCDQKLTPRDARCIHKNAIDGSCSFCTGTPTPTAAVKRFAPVVTKDAAWVEWDTLIVRLAVSGVPSLQSFGFHSHHEPTMYLVRAARYGISSSSSVLAAEGSFNDPMSNNGEVAGYWFDQVDATSPVGFIELRYYLPSYPSRHVDSIEFSDFVDDLEGAANVHIDGNTVPVLFTSFSATPIADGIDVHWQLVSDETMDSYSLYRRDRTSAPARLITQGPVQSARGSYLDRSAQAGSSYRYELIVKTKDGDVFRSPEAIAVLPAVKLTLYPNTPNPFNPQTTIRYDLPGSASARVRLWIVDVSGRMVRTLVDQDQPPGTHEVTWNGTNSAGKGVASGVYFSVLDVDRERRTQKLLLLK